MRRTRRLHLAKETLTRLGPGELHQVGGTVKTIAALASLELTDCLSKFVQCDSYLRPCISMGCTR